MDMNTPSQYGEIEEAVYMQQPEGLEVKGKENLVCKLKKSLYGLKQAPRNWHNKLTDFLKASGFEKRNADSSIYILNDQHEMVIIGIYVDDLLVITKSKQTMKRTQQLITSVFKCKDLGEIHYLPGVQIKRNRVAGTLPLIRARTHVASWSDSTWRTPSQW